MMLKLAFRTFLENYFSRRRSLKRTIRRRPGFRKTLASTQYLEDRTLLSAVTWTGLGGDSNWSNGSNWDTANAPGANDTVTIGAGASVNLDTNVDVQDLIINGTLVGGIFDIQVSEDLSVGAVGVFSSSGEITLDGNQHANIAIDASATVSIQDLTIHKGNYSTVNIGEDFQVNGDLTLENLGAISGPGKILVNQNVTTYDTSVSGNGTIVMNGVGTLAAGVNAGDISNLEITGDVTIDGTHTISVTGDWTQTSGSVNTAGSTVQFERNANVNAVSHFDHVNLQMGNYDVLTATSLFVDGTLSLNNLGSISGTVNAAGDVTTNDASVSGSGTILMTGNGVTLSAGVDFGDLPNVEITGDVSIGTAHPLSVTGDWTQTSGSVNTAGSTVQFERNANVNAVSHFDHVNLQMGNYDVLTATSLFVDGTLSLNNLGSISGTVNAAGDVTTNDASVSGSGTILMTGNGVTLSAGVDFGDLPNVEITGDVSIGTAHPLSVTGDWTQTSGSVNTAGSTVQFERNANVNAVSHFDHVNLQMGNYDVLTATSLFVDGTLSLNNLGSISGTVNAAGDVTTNDASVSGSGTILMTGNGVTLSAGVDFGDLPNVEITGNVTIDPTHVLSVTGDWTQTTGSVNTAGSTVQFERNATVNAKSVFDNVKLKMGNYDALTVVDLDVNGNLALENLGSIVGADLTVAGDVITSDNSISGNSSIIMDGGSNAILRATVAGAEVPDLIIKKGSYATVAVEGDVQVDGDLTLISLRGIDGPGRILVNQNVTTSDTSVGGNGTIVMNGTGTLSATQDGADVPSIVIDTAGAVTIDPAYIVAVSGDWTEVSGTVHTAGSTVQFEGPTTVNAATAFDNVNVRMGSYDTLHAVDLDVDGNLYLISLRGIDGTVTVGGDVTTRDTSVNGGTIVMDGIGTLSSEVNAGDVPSIEITGDVTIASGNTIAVTGDWTQTSGTVHSAGSTVQFEGPTTVNAATAFDNVNVRMGSYDTLHAVDLDVDGNLYLISLRGIDGTVTVGGDVTTRDTSVNGGTIVMDGTGTLSSEVNAGDVPSIEITGDVTIAAGNTIAVTGDWTQTSGTVHSAGSTVQFEGPTTVNAATAFDNVNVRMGSYDTLHAVDLDVDGNLYLISLRGIDGTVTVGGDVTTRDTSVNGGTIVMDGTGTLSSEVNAGDVPSIEITGDVTIASGNTIAVTGDWTQTSGTVHSAGSTVQFEGPTTVNAATAFDNVNVRMGSYDTLHAVDLDVDGNLYLISLRGIDGTVTVGGDVTTRDTSVNGGTIVMDGTGSLAAEFDGADVPNLVINSNGVITIDPAHVVAVTGDWTQVHGSVVTTGSTVQFEGPTTVDAASAFNDVIVRMGSYDTLSVIDMDVNGDLTLKSLRDINGADITVAGDVITSDTSVTGDSTIVMDGYDATLQATVNGADLPNLEIKKWSAEVVTVLGDVQVNGDLSLTSMKDLNGPGRILVKGDLNLQDTQIGGSGTIVMNGTGSVRALVDYADLPTLVIDTNHTVTLDPDHIISVTGNWDLVSGNVVTTGSTVQFQGNTNVDSSIAFENVIISMGSADTLNSNDLYVNGDLTINSLKAINGNIYVSGNVTTGDTSVGGSGTIVMTGTGTIAATVDGADLPSLEINSAGTVTIDAGHVLSVTGNWTEIAGTVMTTGSTVQFQGNTTVDAASAFNNVILSMGSADTLFLSQDMDINGDLTINSLSQVQGARFLLAGNLDVNDAGVYGSPKFVLDGTGAIQTIEAAGPSSLGSASFEILDNKTGEDAQLLSDVDALDVVFSGGASLDQNGFLLNGV